MKPGDICKDCGLERREHHHDGAAYGCCGQFSEIAHAPPDRQQDQGETSVVVVCARCGSQDDVHSVCKNCYPLLVAAFASAEPVAWADPNLQKWLTPHGKQADAAMVWREKSDSASLALYASRPVSNASREVWDAGEHGGCGKDSERAFKAASWPSHLEQTTSGIIDWKMEAERANRLLADVERATIEGCAKHFGLMQSDHMMSIEDIVAKIRTLNNSFDNTKQGPK